MGQCEMGDVWLGMIFPSTYQMLAMSRALWEALRILDSSSAQHNPTRVINPLPSTPKMKKLKGTLLS